MRAVDSPNTPPSLDERISLSGDQVERLSAVLAQLSKDLDGLPVVLSQQGEAITAAGSPASLVTERLAKLADRIWREGAEYPTREVIRFEEEKIEEIEQANFLLYSAHVKGALTLNVGWQMTISLTQVRAEVADTREQLERILQ